MVELNKNELKKINGGAAVATYLIVGGIIVFLIGVIDGYVRPLKCN